MTPSQESLNSAFSCAMFWIMMLIEISLDRHVESMRSKSSGSATLWAKYPAPYRISAAGFRALAPEPHVRLSTYTALYLPMTYRLYFVVDEPMTLIAYN